MSTSADREFGGHLLVKCLLAQGVTHVFGVPGESYLAVLDGFYQYRDDIRFIINRQEGGAAFMAEAHGKLTGRPGVCFVTRGPGATNASIGLHTAFQDSTPMVMFVGDVAGSMRDREAFQEVNYLSFFGPSTKGMAKLVERIDQVERIPEYVSRAFATAMNGRRGPVVLVLPEDMLTEPVPLDASGQGPRAFAQADVVETGIPARSAAALRDLLFNAERPLVIAGGSGWTPQAARDLQSFAEKWSLPVANAFRFQDTFDNHHPLYVGDVGLGINPALGKRITQSDLILAIGPRLGEITSGSYALIAAPQPTQALVHIHTSADELNRVFQTRLAIHAGMPAAAEALAALHPPGRIRWQEWSQSCHQDYLANTRIASMASLPEDTSQGLVNMPSVIATLQKHLPPDAVLTNGAGNFASWLHRYFRYHGLVKGQKTQLAPTNGAMGYGVPAGIAAAITTGRTVVTLAGDGDFLMTGQELATAAQHGAKSIVIVLNNGMYGTIRMHQEREYPTHVSGSSLANPDFAALARAYGFAGVRIGRSDEFEAVFLEALARSQGTLIEIIQEPQAITTRATLNDIRQAALKRKSS